MCENHQKSSFIAFCWKPAEEMHTNNSTNCRTLSVRPSRFRNRRLRHKASLHGYSGYSMILLRTLLVLWDSPLRLNKHSRITDINGIVTRIYLLTG